MTPAQELREHLERVKKGWGQNDPAATGLSCAGWWSPKPGRVSFLSDEAFVLLLGVIGVGSFESPLSDYDMNRLAVWNDTPGRTKEEVITALERAIELAEEQEIR